MQRLRTDEWAARTYATYCEVWQSQQKPLSPDFLRAICKNSIRLLVSARVGAVTSELASEERRTNRHNAQWLKSATESFSRSMELLFCKWQRSVEIDAKSLEYMLGASNDSPAVDRAARDLIYARTQLRYFDAKIVSAETSLVTSERDLSAMQVRPPDAYRFRTIEQIIEKLTGTNFEKSTLNGKRDSIAFKATPLT